MVGIKGHGRRSHRQRMIGRNFSPFDTEQQATSSTVYDCPGFASTARCTISFRTCQKQSDVDALHKGVCMDCTIPWILLNKGTIQ